jgi:hypothetical protein
MRAYLLCQGFSGHLALKEHGLCAYKHRPGLLEPCTFPVLVGALYFPVSCVKGTESALIAGLWPITAFKVLCRLALHFRIRHPKRMPL